MSNTHTLLSFNFNSKLRGDQKGKNKPGGMEVICLIDEPRKFASVGAGNPNPVEILAGF